MTTDTKTPDPTPALLSAARLAEIRAADAADTHPVASTEGGHDRRALLAHIDALTPRAAPDGEALGRGLYDRMGAAQVAFYEVRAIYRTVPPWESLDGPARGLYITAALALHAIGYAAGRSEGEAERARAVHADFAGGLSVCATPGETTKDVARITCPACWAKLYSVAVDDADRMRTGIDVLTAERDAARRDGAREEREAILLRLSHLRETWTNMNEGDALFVLAQIVGAIEERGPTPTKENSK